MKKLFDIDLLPGFFLSPLFIYWGVSLVSHGWIDSHSIFYDFFYYGFGVMFLFIGLLSIYTIFTLDPSDKKITCNCIKHKIDEDCL